MRYLYAAFATLVIVSSCTQGNRGGGMDVNHEGTAASAGVDSEANIADSISLLMCYPLPDGTEYDYTFLEFGAVGCAPCKKMEKETEIIRNEFAGKVNVRFVNLSKKWNRPWAEHFGIQTIPAQIILNSRGIEIYRHSGYIPADELKKIFK